MTGYVGVEEAHDLVGFLSREGGINLGQKDRLMLVALHACGDLTPSILR